MIMRYIKETFSVGLLLILMILIGSGIVYYVNNHDHMIGELHQIQERSKDTLFVYKVGEKEVATISLLTATNAELLQKIQTQDQTLKRLQNLAKDLKEQNKQYSEIISGSTLTKIDTVMVYRTIPNSKDTSKTEREYQFRLDKWVTGSLNTENNRLQMEIYNEYDIIQSRDSITVINHNPYASTRGLRSFKIIPPKVKNKRWGLGPVVGYGIYPTKPFIGVGLQYNVIQW